MGLNLWGANPPPWKHVPTTCESKGGWWVITLCSGALGGARLFPRGFWGLCDSVKCLSVCKCGSLTQKDISMAREKRAGTPVLSSLLHYMPLSFSN